MQRNERIRFIIASIINVAIFGMVIYVLITLIKSLNYGHNRFIYFTNISSLSIGVVALIHAILLIVSVFKNKVCVPRLFSLIKMIVVSMMVLTFLTVLLVIGPLDGYPKNYQGRNFFSHLIIPILCFVSYIFFEEKLELEWKYSLFVLVPLVTYGIVYVTNVIILKTWEDLYQIDKFGIWYVFIIAFLIVDFGIGQGIYFLKKYIDRKSRP